MKSRPASGGSMPQRRARGAGCSAALLLVVCTAAVVSTAVATGCDSGILQMKPFPQDTFDTCYNYPFNTNSIKGFCTTALRVRVQNGIIKIVPLVEGTYKYADVGPGDQNMQFNCKDANASGLYFPGSTTSASVMLYDDFGGPLSNLTKTGANQITLTPGRTYSYRGPPPTCQYNYTVVQGCVLGVKAPANPPTTCPAGSYKTKGRFGTPYCAPCAAGTYSSKAGDACKPCPAGTYSSFPGSTRCTKCAANSYSKAPGSISCDYCSPYDNYYTDGKKCSLCPKGSYAVSEYPGQCVRCSAGKKCCTVGWSQSCPKCSAATGPATAYTSIFALESTAPTSCLATPHALCTPKLNITVDHTCTISLNNLDYSNNPDDNSYCSWTATQVITGSQLSITDLARFDYFQDNSLIAGNFTAAASPYLTVSIPATKCTLRYRALTAPLATLLGAAPKPSKATTCPAGRYLETKTDAKPGPCLLCPAGTYSPSPSSGRGCIRCPAGTYAKGYGNTKCTRCPAGRASTAGSAFCPFCDQGKQPAPGGKGCRACPKDSEQFFRGTGGQCLGNAYGTPCCAAGDCKGQTLCKGPRKSTSAFPSDTYTAVLQLVSKSLPQPSCSNATLLSCLPANGKLLLSSSSSSSPVAINLQYYRTPSTCGISQIYGAYSAYGGYTNTKAAYVTTYQDGQGNSAYGLISDLSKGTVTIYLSVYTDNDAVTPIPAKASAACSATFKLVNGYAFDLKPPTGAKCHPGDVVTTISGRNFCSVCPTGQFKNATGVCQDCPSGYYNDKEGASTCKPCRAGYSCYSGSSQESGCTGGQYNSKPKQGECATCPANTYGSAAANAAVTKCTPCPKGTIAPKGAAACGVAWDKVFPA